VLADEVVPGLGTEFWTPIKCAPPPHPFEIAAMSTAPGGTVVG
jgi:hypothetical protein